MEKRVLVAVVAAGMAALLLRLMEEMVRLVLVQEVLVI